MPRHIALIMDGNGRWAKERGLPRFEGHRAGRQSIRETVEACDELGVEYLTVYAFSAENWRRPKLEVDALMVLIEATLREEAVDLHASKVRVRLLGKREGLPEALLAEMGRVEAMTAENDGLTLQIAINYGGRQEIVDAAASLARDVASGALSADEIEESSLAERLYLPDTPDPDLLIRAGGEHRVSNYLLWEIAYTEIYVTPVLWPDFRKVHLYQALVDYHGRQRRFGGVNDVS
ncbi:MAG: polyprenyl diphosphate synthase [Armatimonadetes bacterium]|nr:polyprenyl diphosphate synthase [Armatimonadota bacterium]